ncbi:DUF4214 domain-containing protein [Undibacterium sp. Di24W]|uniref:DUF4214 domain-containing protein n=1 Tax=Undibacterium sp. Di24W TaxID=3413033 RepID=UPI003BF2BC5A
MAVVNYQYELIKMYLAAFIRAPEMSGLDYWMLQLNNGKSFDNVLDTVFNLDIVKAIYPTNLPNQSFVTLIYVNVFGKAPDLEGLNYWTKQINEGRARGNLVMDMINAGLGTPDGTSGKAYIVNRLASSQFAVEQQFAQRADFTPDYLKNVMTSVTADAATVTAAAKAMNSSVTGVGLGAPVNAVTISAAAEGLSAAEVKAGVSVVVDLKGTNAVINNTIELLINRSAFSTPVSKLLTDTDIKAQKVTLIIPNTVNWGNDGSKSISAYVKDSAGYAGLAGGDLVVDLNVFPPNAPTKPISIAVASNGINAAEKASGVDVKVDLTGTAANKGDKVDILIGGVVFSPAASTVLTDADVKAGFAMVLVSGAANWGTDGEKILSARVTDLAGNIGGIGGTLAVMLDATSPGAITNTLVISAANGGISPEERNASMPVIVNLNGSNAQAGDSVELLIDGKVFSNSTLRLLTAGELVAKSVTLNIAASDVAWGTTDGDRSISARLVDQAGNPGTAGGILKVTLDSTPPNSQNATLSVSAAENGLNLAEINAGVSVVVNLTNTGALAGDVLSLLFNGQPFNPVVSFVLTSSEITAKAATVVIPSTVNWGSDGNKILSATLTDSAGNIGVTGKPLTVVVDKTPPTAPTNPVQVAAAFNGINTQEKTAGVVVVVDLTGTGAQAGDKVEIVRDGAAFTVPVLQTLSTTDVTAGTIAVTVPQAAGWGNEGAKTIAARLVDNSGNTSASSPSFNAILDTIAPSAPGSVLLVPANAGGGITSSERSAGVNVVVNLNNTNALAGDMVEILIGGVAFATPVLYTLSAADITAKSATASIATGAGWGIDGDKILTARFIDTAGNIGAAGGSVTVTLDGTAPGTPSGTLQIAAAASGISNSEKIAGVAVVVDLTGTGAVAGDTVNLQIDGNPFTTPVSQVLNAANVTAKSVSLTIPTGAGWGADGSKVISANIVDSLGNVGAVGAAVNVTLDTLAPTGPVNPIAIPVASNSISLAEKNAGVSVIVDLNGSTAVAGDKVELLLAGLAFATPVTQVLTATDITNLFATMSIPSAAGWGSDGSKVISARLSDVAGNVGVAAGALTVTLDTTAPNGPSNPLVVSANAGGGITGAEKNAGVIVAVNLNGTNAVAGDVVEILIGGSAFATPVTYTLTAPDITAQTANLTILSTSGWGADGSKALTARLTDVAGNVGTGAGSVTVTLLDTTPPNAPSSSLVVPAASNGISAAEKSAGVVVTASLAGTSGVAGDTATLFIDGAGFATPVTHLLTGAEVTAGNFNFTILSGAGWGIDGTHLLNMSITDVAGNIGAVGGDISVVLDTIAPTSPSNAVVITAASNGINAAEQAAGVLVTINLSGTNAVANDKVEVLLGGVAFATPVLHTLSAAEIIAGSANATILLGSGWGTDGVKTIAARVVDVAGNVGAIGGSLTTSLDTTIPAAVGLPVYTDVDNSSTKNSGDTYLFTVSEATNKVISIANVSVNNSHNFGTGAFVNWSPDGKQLLLTLGTGATVTSGDIVTLIGVSDVAGNSLDLAFAI